MFIYFSPQSHFALKLYDFAVDENFQDSKFIILLLSILQQNGTQSYVMSTTKSGSDEEVVGRRQPGLEHQIHVRYGIHFCSPERCSL